MNRIVLIGRIGQNVEAREAGGQTVCSFSLATSERYTAKDGTRKEVTEWHSCSVWGQRAQNLAPHLTKGKLVAVTGSVHYRKAERDGVTGYYTDIRVDEVMFLSSPDRAPQPQPAPQPSQEFRRPQPKPAEDFGDLPF